MGPAQFLCQNVTGKVALVHALRHHDEDTVIEVIQARRHRLVPKSQRLLTHPVALGLANIMGIIEDDDVGAFAGDHPVFRGCKPVAAPVVLETADIVAFAPKQKTLAFNRRQVSPTASIPVRTHDVATLDAVPGGEIAGIRQVHEFDPGAAPGIGTDREPMLAPGIGILRPSPGRQEDVDRERFHVTGWQVDQQSASDLPIYCRGEMVADRVDVPIALELSRLNATPTPPDKIAEIGFAQPDVGALDLVERPSIERKASASEFSHSLVLVWGESRLFRAADGVEGLT